MVENNPITPPQGDQSNAISVEAGRGSNRFVLLTEANRLHPDRNEDSAFVEQTGRFFVLADGMGAPHLGPADIASRKAVEGISLVLGRVNPSEGRRRPMIEAMQQAFSQGRLLVASEFNRMAENSNDGEEPKDIATTAVAGYQYQDEEGNRRMIIGNVGDSRVYLLRDGKLIQITEDQTMLDEETLDPEEKSRLVEKFSLIASDEDLDNLTAHEDEQFSLYKSVRTSQGLNGMGKREYKLAIYNIILEAGDIVLACTDGISDEFINNEMEEILTRREGLAEKADDLMKAAHDRGLEDHFLSKNDDRTLLLLGSAA